MNDVNILRTISVFPNSLINQYERQRSNTIATTYIKRFSSNKLYLAQSAFGFIFETILVQGHIETKVWRQPIK